jgi:site-specific recombinase XerD
VSARLTLAKDSVDLVAAFAAELTGVGLTAGPSTIGGARGFCARYPTAATFSAAPLAEQLGLGAHQRRFACWLMVTARMSVSASYLARADLRLGAVAARHYPDLRARLGETARTLGSDHTWILAQWSTLAQLAALHGVPPQAVTAAQLESGGAALLEAFADPAYPTAGHKLRSALVRLRATLFHAGMTDTPPRLHRPNTGVAAAAAWTRIAPTFAETARRYLAQIEVSLRPSTVRDAERSLRELGLFLAEHTGEVEVHAVADITRDHIEAYKTWLATRPRHYGGGTLHRHTIGSRLTTLRCFFERITEWGYPDAPSRPLIFAGDLPIPDQPLPRFLDDAASATLLRAARADPDPFVRLAVEMLARTGLRKGELMALKVDAVVQIGSAYWLRVPIGKLHNDRYIPLHPQLKNMLDDWLADRPDLRSDLIFTDRGRPIPAARVDRALTKLAATAGIDRPTAHQLRHTLATQAINRGMSLEAIAALLGHRTMAMTMIYARIADRTVAQEYFAVSEKVEALYDHAATLPADAEGAEMTKLRRQMHSRMLGNGHCARPVEMDCHFESICESCTFFVTTIEFRPTLQRQRDDAATKGQIGRQKVFEGILERIDHEAS